MGAIDAVAKDRRDGVDLQRLVHTRIKRQDQFSGPLGVGTPPLKASITMPRPPDFVTTG